MKDDPEELRVLNELLAQAGGFESSFIEIRDNGHEILVGGNRSGLIWLASQLLALSAKDSPGAHLHIDSATGADVAERPLVFQLSAAPWPN